MNYYSIFRSDDLKVIGHYPQTELKKDYNPRLPDSHWQVMPFEFPDFKPNLEITLNKDAIPTDYLHFSDSKTGFILSKRFVDFLTEFSLPKHQFYPIKVYHRAELLDYYWFHFIVDDFWNYINRSLSKAVIFDSKQNHEIIGEVDLNLTPDEIKNLKYTELKYHQKMRWERIVFNKEFPRYDVYETKSITYTSILSKKLVTALNEAGLTGFETKLFEKIVCE